MGVTRDKKPVECYKSRNSYLTSQVQSWVSEFQANINSHRFVGQGAACLWSQQSGGCSRVVCEADFILALFLVVSSFGFLHFTLPVHQIWRLLRPQRPCCALSVVLGKLSNNKEYFQQAGKKAAAIRGYLKEKSHWDTCLGFGLLCRRWEGFCTAYIALYVPGRIVWDGSWKTKKKVKW